MSTRTQLTSLPSPKSSTLRRLDDGLRVATVVVGVAMVVCCLVAPPIAGVAIASFTAIVLASLVISEFQRQRQPRELITSPTAEIETLRSARCEFAV